MTRLDDRLIRVTIQVGDTLRTYDENLEITARIIKSANGTQGEATVTVAGLAKSVRDQLLTETSPYGGQWTEKSILVEAGRKSTGVFTLYRGDIIQTGVNEPPNLVTTIKSKVLNFKKADIVSRSFAEVTKLSVIATRIAADLGLILVFEATDRNIQSFTYTGSATKMIDRLNDCGGVNAYADNGKLLVKDAGKALRNYSHVVSEASGMVSVPQLTEYGVKVTYMLDPNSQLGGSLSIESELNPTLSGKYVIYNLYHEINSRATPFYTIAEGFRPGRLTGGTGFPIFLND